MSHVRDFERDGLYLPPIKAHSCEKLEIHNYFAQIFVAGMRKRWTNLVYVGLYSGCGAAEVEDTGRAVMTSALSVLSQEPPFTRYVFVDEDPRCTEALQARSEALGMQDRVTIIRENVNAATGKVIAALPNWRTDGGVLTFCFIDPFKVNLDFEVIRRIAELRVDILLLLPLGYDVRRNWRDYIETPAMRDRLTSFLGESDWVAVWKSLGRPYTEFPRFVQQRMNDAMKRLEFIELDHRDIKDVKVAGMNVYLYSLHLYSRSPVAIKFWRNALKGTSDQQMLDL